MQEESSMRQEAARRATEEQIQAQRRQTEREKAEIERETIRVRAMAEAEGRAHEAKLAEDVNRRMLVDRANAEREKWVAAINTTFDHIGGSSLTTIKLVLYGYKCVELSIISLYFFILLALTSVICTSILLLLNFFLLNPPFMPMGCACNFS